MHHHFLAGIVLSWLTLSLGLWVTAALVPGFEVRGFKGALAVGAVFGVLHWLIGWFLFVIIGFGTLLLGFIFSFITWWFVSAILLKMTDALSENLSIDRFRTALIASAVLSVLSLLRQALLY